MSCYFKDFAVLRHEFALTLRTRQTWPEIWASTLVSRLRKCRALPENGSAHSFLPYVRFINEAKCVSDCDFIMAMKCEVSIFWNQECQSPQTWFAQFYSTHNNRILITAGGLYNFDIDTSWSQMTGRPQRLSVFILLQTRLENKSNQLLTWSYTVGVVAEQHL